MILRFKRPDGLEEIVELDEHPITIGRGREADVVIADEKASRIHCGLRFQDAGYLIRDLKSKNGTLVNGQSIETVRLNPGDRIRIGSTTFFFEERRPAGAETVLRQVHQEMADGKGYSTLLREIVDDADDPERAADR